MRKCQALAVKDATSAIATAIASTLDRTRLLAPAATTMRKNGAKGRSARLAIIGVNAFVRKIINRGNRTESQTREVDDATEVQRSSRGSSNDRTRGPITGATARARSASKGKTVIRNRDRG